ncbi:MAG: hypothetical protein ABR562_02715 [Thermoplasmatota archaeon]|nr:hypothetical protein [Halobacteriales archaeon]
MRCTWAAAALIVVAAPVAAMDTTLHAVLDWQGTGNPQTLQVPEPADATSSLGTCGAPPDSAVADPSWILPFGGVPTEFGFFANRTPRFHPERGLARDIHVQAARLHWVIDLPDDSHLAVPIRIEAWIRASGSADVAELEAAPIVAHGVAAGLWLPAGTHEVEVPLDVVEDGAIAKAAGFSLRVDLHDGKDCASPTEMRIQAVSRPGARSRLDLATREGVYVDFVHPQVAGGIVLVHASANSPFGTSDLHLGDLIVEGPGVPRNLTKIVAPVSHEHRGSSAEVTWTWRFHDEGAPEGTYHLSLAAWNLAHTSSAMAQASFTIQGHGGYGIDDKGQTVTVQEPSAAAGAGPFLIPLLAALTARWRGRAQAISS